MNRDLPVSGQVTRSGHSDGDREEEISKIDLGGEGQPGVGFRTSGAVGQPAHFRRRDLNGNGGPWPPSVCSPALLALCPRAGEEMALVPPSF